MLSPNIYHLAWSPTPSHNELVWDVEAPASLFEKSRDRSPVILFWSLIHGLREAPNGWAPRKGPRSPSVPFSITMCLIKRVQRNQRSSLNKGLQYSLRDLGSKCKAAYRLNKILQNTLVAVCTSAGFFSSDVFPF